MRTYVTLIYRIHAYYDVDENKHSFCGNHIDFTSRYVILQYTGRPIYTYIAACHIYMEDHQLLNIDSYIHTPAP